MRFGRGILALFLLPCVWPFQLKVNPTTAILRGNSFSVQTEALLAGEHRARSTSSSALHVSSLLAADDKAAALDWSFLDAVYLITCPNADPGSERLAKTMKILEETNLRNRVVVKEFDTDDNNRIRGCYASHLSVMRDALKEADRRKKSATNRWLQSFLPPDSDTAKTYDGRDFKVLILEDNLATSGCLDQTTIDSVADYASRNSPWDVVQLSYNPYVPNLLVTRTGHERVVQLRCGAGSALGTTAYIINEEGMRAVVDHDENEGFYAPIPDVMAELFPSSRFAAFPSPFVRAPKTKSLVNPQLDELRELLFQPSVACQVQNLLTLTGLSTNALLPITVVVLLLSTLLSGRSTVDAVWSLSTTGSFEGPIVLTLLSTCFTVLSLGILAQGAMLAPKPSRTRNENE